MTQKERIEKVREALNNGKCLSVEFYKDGSGARFHFIDPHGDHGLPCLFQLRKQYKSLVDFDLSNTN